MKYFFLFLIGIALLPICPVTAECSCDKCLCQISEHCGCQEGQKCHCQIVRQTCCQKGNNKDSLQAPLTINNE